MKLPTKELIQKLSSVTQKPCLSLYMTTHRNHPDNLQDPIRFKNLVKQLEESLAVYSLMEEHAEFDVQKLIEPLLYLGKDNDFWNHSDKGLAVLRNQDTFEVLNLPEPVEELAIVSDSFHTKPLRHYLHSIENFHVLGLTIQDFVLYEGNRYSLIKMELPPDIPKTLTEVLGEDLTQSYSRSEVAGTSRGESANMNHGYGSRKEEVDKDIEKFFRYVANVVYERYSKPSGKPLILAALPEHHSLFQKLSKNHWLLPRGIEINHKSSTPEQLKSMAWQIMEPYYNFKLERIVDRFGEAKAKGLASDDVENVALAAVNGRVDTLLLEENKIIPGKIVNNEIVTIESTELLYPDTDDLLDDVGEIVTRTGGNVLVLPQEKMPTDKGLAAVFRY